ncbi:hypothetical protein LR48_Vigan11g165200 [Vigna angularis]|uniref:Uncharacterized protein n=1 Tax=Phaseolus angularis TaxID=3914 RepID=A0A0L9VUK9_PHAAN|nr:hypothetical protein LR48_Vigan11g165200 [Vigna angularis]
MKWSNDHPNQQQMAERLTARSSLQLQPDSLHSAPLPNARLPLLTSTRMIIAMTRRTYKTRQHKEKRRKTQYTTDCPDCMISRVATTIAHPGDVVTGILINCHPRRTRVFHYAERTFPLCSDSALRATVWRPSVGASDAAASMCAAEVARPPAATWTPLHTLFSEA